MMEQTATVPTAPTKQEALEALRKKIKFALSKSWRKIFRDGKTLD